MVGSWLIGYLLVQSSFIARNSVHAASTDQFKSVIGPLTEACRTEEGATKDDVENVMHRNIVDNRSAKCLLRCVYERLGGMRGDTLGTNEEVMKAYTTVYEGHEEKLKMAPENLTMCREQLAALTDGCDVAHGLLVCMKQFEDQQ